MATAKSTQGMTDRPDLSSMSRQELLELDQRIDRELDSRAFEERLKREVEYHMRKNQRQQRRGKAE